MQSIDPDLHALLQSIDYILFPADVSGREISIDSHDVDGDTPLHVFLWRGDEGTALRLVASGANVNAVGDMGETPLHVAVRKASDQTIAALLIAGANTSVVSEFGQTPEQLAIATHRSETFRRALTIASEGLP